MIAEIVTIGDEICRGEIHETNSMQLAEKLWDLHIPVAWKTACRDNTNDIRHALLAASARCQLVLVSGGLGPTVDDCTVDAVAGLLEVDAVEDPAARDRLEHRYRQKNNPITAVQLRQTRVPEGADVFANPCGIAPGFGVRLNEISVICMPGVPRELQAMFEEQIAPYIQELPQRRALPPLFHQKQTYRVFDMGESTIAQLIEPPLRTIPNLSLHFRPQFPETLVTVSVECKEPSQGAAALNRGEKHLRELLGNHIYATGENTMAHALGESLCNINGTLATAESCTGGMVGSLITSVPGASRYYLGGAICYTNHEKQRQLGVSQKILTSAGAVSEACAIAMAQGARERFLSSYAISVTGIAGPGGAQKTNALAKSGSQRPTRVVR